MRFNTQLPSELSQGIDNVLVQHVSCFGVSVIVLRSWSPQTSMQRCRSLDSVAEVRALQVRCCSWYSCDLIPFEPSSLVNSSANGGCTLRESRSLTAELCLKVNAIFVNNEEKEMAGRTCLFSELTYFYVGLSPICKY